MVSLLSFYGLLAGMNASNAHMREILSRVLTIASQKIKDGEPLIEIGGE